MIRRAPDDGPAYRKFVGATYGASVLTRDEDYTAASGSLILTLQPDFLETLDPGTHTVNVHFSDVAETDPVPVTFTGEPHRRGLHLRRLVYGSAMPERV